MKWNLAFPLLESRSSMVDRGTLFGERRCVHAEARLHADYRAFLAVTESALNTVEWDEDASVRFS